MESPTLGYQEQNLRGKPDIKSGPHLTMKEGGRGVRKKKAGQDSTKLGLDKS